MAATLDATVKSRLETLIALARLLQTIEGAPTRAGADQYRALVGKLDEVLAEDLPAEALKQILSHFPATAQLYENLRYEHAGLMNAPLELSVKSEQEASKAIARWRGRVA